MGLGTEMRESGIVYSCLTGQHDDLGISCAMRRILSLSANLGRIWKIFQNNPMQSRFLAEISDGINPSAAGFGVASNPFKEALHLTNLRREGAWRRADVSKKDEAAHRRENGA
jgi:hypothetical protein